MSLLFAIAPVPNQSGRAMTFELVKAGWPNTVAIVALAAMPMLTLLQPAPPTPQPSIVETADLQNSTLVLASQEIE
jgi:hypothetical protein